MNALSEVLQTWEPVIGLEVHAQLATDSKIFCGCTTAFGAEPNHHTCPVCLGHPGVLPVLNRKVVDHAIRLGLALGCEIRARSVWARKNYFYPDLPKGYQISQYELPICEHGTLAFEGAGGAAAEASIVRIHMEEDAGKSVHGGRPGRSAVDLNRAGVPLLEIVSGPDLRGAEDAAAYLKTLRQILRYLGICDGNMEQGSLRCDANVSLRRRGTEPLGTRAEIKNLNSFRFLQKAIEYEIRRQADVLERGDSVVQETRLYDPGRDETRSMRSKEEAHDYRYFPDPDLPPLHLVPERIAAAREMLPELPGARRARFVTRLGLDPDAAEVLTAERETADFFEATLFAYGGEARPIAALIQTLVLREVNERGGFGALKLTPERLAALQKLVDGGAISGSAAKEVFAELVVRDVAPETVVEEKGLAQVSDTAALESAVDAVLAANPGEVEKYRAGKKNLIGFFMGRVMKETGGKANPKVVQQLLRERLGG
jgi:aspartyl-tRNA(Asn)/glutamyl-tRNA(Gln) amidotransferase subunit B